MIILFLSLNFHRVLLLLPLCALVLTPICFAEDTPGPFGPLSPGEKARAYKAAVTDPKIIEFLGEPAKLTKYRVCSMEVVPPTIPESGKLKDYKRQALIVLYNPNGNRGITATIDLTVEGGTTVIERELLDPQNIPLAPQDIEEAFSLIKKDPAIFAKLSKKMPTGLKRDNLDISVKWQSENDAPCHHDRCLEVFIHEGDRYMPHFSVIINVTKGELTSVDK